MFRLGAINDELSSDLVRGLDLAVELGLQEVEIHTVGRKCIEEASDEELRALQEMVVRRGLRVCNLSSTVFLRCHLDGREDAIELHSGFRSIAGGYTRHLQGLERALFCAQVLGAPWVRIFGFWRSAPLSEDIYDQTSEKLFLPLQMAQTAGIPLILENCPHTPFDWGERAIRLVERLDSAWLRMLWDPCTGLRSGEPDILATYDRIRPRLAHVHAKDIHMNPASKRGHVYVPIGQGEMNWLGILRRLAADRYPGVISLETHHLGPDGAKESAAAAMARGMQTLMEQISAKDLLTRNGKDGLDLSITGRAR